LSAGIGGAAGLLVAVIIALLEPLKSFPDALLITLWPTSIFGFGYNGGGGLTGILVATFVFGGNALVYAAAVSGIVGCVIKVRHLFDPSYKQPLSIRPK
jgi:hypothetical protein